MSPNGNPIQGPFECYLSDAFSTGNVILDKEGAFKTFVATRYGVNVVNQGCPVAAHKSSAEAALKINLANCNGRSWKVIESGWKFEPPG